MLTTPFRAFGVNVAGNAVVDSKRADRRDFLKFLADHGVEFIRLHHVAKNQSDDGKSLYEPTYADCEAALGIQRDWLDDCADLGIRCWITAQARQRVREDEVKDAGLREVLFGKRPSGVSKGEIADTFFWFPEAGAIVDQWIGTVAQSVKDHPALMVFTLANEELCTKWTGYHAAGVRKDPDNPLKRVWLENLDIFQDRFQLTDRDMTKARTAEFHAWMGYRAFLLHRGAAEACGVKCAINATSVWGDAPMAALCETAAGDIDDFHLYPYAGQPDPYDAEADRLAQRTWESVACALHRAGRELCCSEHADVLEMKPPQKAPGYYREPLVVAEAQRRQDVAVTCYYAAMQAKLPGKDGAWNGSTDEKLVSAIGMACDIVNNPRIERVEPVVTQLTYDDVFGTGNGPAFVAPQPGSQPWAKQAAASGKPHRVRLPELKWMG